jgi:hypothetical protein
VPVVQLAYFQTQTDNELVVVADAGLFNSTFGPAPIVVRPPPRQLGAQMLIAPACSTCMSLPRPLEVPVVDATRVKDTVTDFSFLFLDFHLSLGSTHCNCRLAYVKIMTHIYAPFQLRSLRILSM